MDMKQERWEQNGWSELRVVDGGWWDGGYDDAYRALEVAGAGCEADLGAELQMA